MERGSLFSGRKFLPLFAAQAIAAFTDNALRYAITILVVYQLAAADGGGSFVALGTALFILPYFLFSALAGELADKRDKAALARRLKLFQLLIMLAGAASLWLESLPLFLVILFLAGTEAAFFSPVKYGLLPQHLPKSQLLAANGWVEMATFVAVLAGILFGGGLVLSAMGREIVAASVAVLSLLAFLAARRILPAPPLSHTSLTRNPLTGNLALYAQAVKRKDVFRAILGISWFWFTGALMLTLFPPFTKQLLGGDAGVANLFVASFTVGIAAGSLTANRFLNGDISARFAPLSGLLMAFGLFDLWMASPDAPPGGDLIGVTEFLAKPESWRILADLLVLSFAGGVFVVPLNAYMQAKTPAPRRARVLAANNMLNALFMAASSAMAAIAFALGQSAKELFLILAIGNLAAAILAGLWMPEELLRQWLRAFFRLSWGLKAQGLEHARAKGAAVVVANHQSRLDLLLLACHLAERPVVAMDPLTARHASARILRMIADITIIDPENPLSVRPLVQSLKEGRKVILLPEPHATSTGALMKIEETPAMIAHMAGSPLLPARIDGAQMSRFSRLRHSLRRKGGPVRLAFRPRERLEAGDAKGNALRQKLSLSLYELMTRVQFETSPVAETLPEALLRAITAHGRGREILEDIERKPLTYGRILLGMFILGRALAKLTRAQKHVGVLLPNASGALITLLGLLAGGRIPAMLNYSTGGPNMLAALTAAQIDTVVTSRRFIAAAKLEPELDMLAARARVIYLDDVRAGLTAFNKLAGMAAARMPRLALRMMGHNPDPDATAVVLFTSGSEGVPKGVALSHRNINVNRQQTQARIDFTTDDRMMNPLPMFHAFGLVAGTLLPVLGGVRTFLYPSPLHYKAVPEMCYASDATILVATDTFLMGYGKNAHAHDFHRLRFVVAGAERVKQETRDLWFDRFGLRILEGYGATECAPVLSVNTPMFCKAGTTGRIYDGLSWRLDPVEGIERGGRLFVKGPNVMQGYLRADNPGVLEQAPDGWYDTGDIVDIDAEGFITILGRAKRFCKVAGEMISLNAVELAVQAAFPEFAHAVVAVPDSRKGEQLVLITTHPSLERKLLQEALKGRLSEIMVPRQILGVAELPVLGTGKTDYVSLNRMAREAVLA